MQLIGIGWIWHSGFSWKHHEICYFLFTVLIAIKNDGLLIHF